MDVNVIKKAIEEIRAKGPKRNFKQSIDLVINIKNLDVKKTPISGYHPLKHSFKNIKVCCFSDDVLKAKAEKIFDNVITKGQLGLMNDKKEIKKLAKEFDFFVAQADLMPLIASKLGKILGSRGKMPNPGAGCVFLPDADLGALKNRLQFLKRIQTKNEAVIRVCVGKEDLKDEEIADNVKDIYDYVVGLLPEGKNNVKNVLLKLTMGPVYKIGSGFENINADVKKEAKNKVSKIQDKKETKMGGVENG